MIYIRISSPIVIYMASISFTKRFRDKYEKVGKNGLVSLKTLNPIEKSDIPPSKLHKSIITLLPHKPNPKIMHQPSCDDLPQSTSRSISSSKLLPSIKTMSGKLVLMRNHSRSPIDSSDACLSVSGRAKETGVSYSGLPKLSQKYYNLKKIMRLKLLPLKKLNQQIE